MTKANEIQVACANCGAEHNATAYDSINVSLEPLLREQLFAGEINTYQCESCDYEGILEVPLLYHDMERAFTTWFWPLERIDDPGFAIMFKPDGSLVDLGGLAGAIDRPEYFSRPHIVFDFVEMLRYIMFREMLSGIVQEQEE